MVDTTILVLVPESGDGIQTLKSGVMEIADVFVVNKADRLGAEKLRQEIEITLGIRRGNAFRGVPAHHGFSARGKAAAAAARAPADAAWEHSVVLTTATKGDGVPELLTALDRHHEWLAAAGELAVRRRRRLLDRTREVVNRATRRWIWEETRAESLITERLDEVVEGRLSPYDVATEVLDGIRQGERI
jgi:LAO/AO transport system kinase